MKVTAKITGYSDIAKSIKSIQAAMKGALEDIAGVGALPIENEAKLLAPVITGTLRRSISTQITSSSPTQATATIGPNTPYAARIEFGFIGVDSLGRHYNQSPEPYMRPAFDTKQGEAIAAMAEIAREIINEALDSESSQRAQAYRRRNS